VYHKGKYEMYLLLKGRVKRGSTTDKKVSRFLSDDGFEWEEGETLLVATHNPDFMPYRTTVFYDENGNRHVYPSYQLGWINYVFNRGPMAEYKIGMME
jgi:hypothetical protein